MVFKSKVQHGPKDGFADEDGVYLAETSTKFRRCSKEMEDCSNARRQRGESFDDFECLDG